MEMFNFDESFIAERVGKMSRVQLYKSAGQKTDYKIEACSTVYTPNGSRAATAAEYRSCSNEMNELGY